MIFYRAVCALCAMGALSFLGGCALLAPPDTGPRAEPFDVLGRVLVNYDGRAFSSSVRWQHGAQSDELWLMTPTGQALAHVREDHRGATITSTDQTQYHGASADALLRQAMGWEFPLARLQHWLRGQPAPIVAADILERDSNGRITRMTQDGWRIGCEYYAVTEQDGLPRRIDISNAAQTIRVVIDSWRRESQADDSAPAIFITR